jgi:hypothetical protein
VLNVFLSSFIQTTILSSTNSCKMHIYYLTWLIVAVCIGDVNAVKDKTSGIVGVDLVFPRNETYAPTQFFPIAWAFQDTQLARLLDVNLEFELQGWNVLDNIGAGPRNSSIRLRWLSESLSRDPFFQYSPFQQLSATANWELSWKIYWNSCTNGSSSVDTASGATFTDFAQGSLTFTTRDGAQKPDLVSGTKDTSCSRNSGVQINVIDTQGEGTQACAVVASPSPASTQTPCRVQIDSAAAASISSSISATLCRSVPVRTDCSMHNEEKKSTAQSLTVGSLAGLLAVSSLFVHVLAFKSH